MNAPSVVKQTFAIQHFGPEGWTDSPNWTLTLGEGNIINTYTGFVVLHVYAAIWGKNCIFLNAKNSPVKYGAEILFLIEVAVIHYHVHQKENSQITQGNNKADQEAKKQPWCPYQVETNIEQIQQQAAWLQ